MLTYLYRYASEVIFLIGLLTFLLSKDVDSPWDRVINSDGKGYYAYLPAIFIYQDPEFGFEQDYEQQYYPEGSAQVNYFKNEIEGDTVNKYFGGAAVLWTPFFLSAHALSSVSEQPADGYSIYYQYAIALAGLVFLWIGCQALFKILQRFKIPPGPQMVAVLSLVLGTNLFFYAIYNGAFTHVYNFALINLFVLFLMQFQEEDNPRWLWLTALVFGLIVLTRPQNGLVLVFIPLVAGSIENSRRLIARVFSHPKRWGMALGIVCAVLFIQPLLWYWQTGSWLVDSYGEEGWNFLSPEIVNILFSYHKGWFLYTPLALIALLGFVKLFRQDNFRGWALLGSLGLVIYVMASWSCWWYGGAFGLRAFVDFYGIIGLLLAFLAWDVSRSKLSMSAGAIVLLAAIGLNQIQTYQYRKSILPFDNITKEIYWDNFLRLHRQARVAVDAANVKERSVFSHDMESEQGLPWVGEENRSDALSYSGNKASVMNGTNPYSLGFRTQVGEKYAAGELLVRVKVMVHSNRSSTESKGVIEINRDGERLLYSYTGFKPYVPKNNWTLVEFTASAKEPLTGEEELKIYMWSPEKGETVAIDDLEVQLIRLKEPE